MNRPARTEHHKDHERDDAEGLGLSPEPRPALAGSWLSSLLHKGEKVVATARKPEQIAEFSEKYPETALAVALDVTSQTSVDAAVKGALDRFGRVDVLVNNAGYGLAGAIEEATEAEFMPVFETNVFGLLRVTKALLPQFRTRKSGHIVNLSSNWRVDRVAGLGVLQREQVCGEWLVRGVGGGDDAAGCVGDGG